MRSAILISVLGAVAFVAMVLSQRPFGWKAHPVLHSVSWLLCFAAFTLIIITLYRPTGQNLPKR